MEKQEFMKTRKVLPLLMSMAVPMMLSMLMQSLYNIVDSIFVAKLGTQALTAVSLVYPLQNIVVSVAVGMGVGITSAVARRLGEKDQEKANQAAAMGMFLTAIHCVVIVLLGIIFIRPFLELFTKDPLTLQWAQEYAYIVICLSSGALFNLCVEKIFQATGAMVTTMFALALGCIVNVILDPIMIFGLFGFPRLEVAGAAIATVIGQFSGLLLYIILYLKKDYGIRISFRCLKLEKEAALAIYKVGLPSSIMMGLPSILVSILNSLLIQFSELYVAVLGVYLKLQTFIYMPANGIVQGMRPIISYNYGAEEGERVKKTIRWSLVVTAGIMAVGTILALVIPGPILSMFDSEEQFLREGITALRIISLGFLISTVSIVYSGTFEALGRGMESLVVSVLRQFIVILVLGYALSRIWGVIGIWISYPVAEGIAAIAAFLLYRRIARRMLDGGTTKK